MERCGWAGPEQIYLDYHDTEWGVPEFDSRALWEKLVLDGFQAGLSWITILKKRDSFRAAFADFDPNVIARWGEREVALLLQDKGIIRHRGKIEATITNAQAWQRLEARGLAGSDRRAAFGPRLWHLAACARVRPLRPLRTCRLLRPARHGWYWGTRR